MPKRTPKPVPATEPTKPEPEPDPSSFYQQMFDQLMAAHPELNEHGEVLAAAVTVIVSSTYKEARRFTAAQIIDHVQEFWRIRRKRKLSQRLKLQIEKNPGMLYEIVAAVGEELIVDSIKGLMSVEGSTTADVIGRTRGSA